MNILLNVSDNVADLEGSKNIASIKINDVEEITSDNSILEVFPKIKNKLIKDKEGIDLIVNVTNDINAKTVKDNATFTKIFEPKIICNTIINNYMCYCFCFNVFDWKW